MTPRSLPPVILSRPIVPFARALPRALVACLTMALAAVPAGCGSGDAGGRGLSGWLSFSHGGDQGGRKQQDRAQRKEARKAAKAAEQEARDAATVASMIHVVPLADPGLTDERSAAAASRAVPGLFYTINDSGNEPELFAFDTTGALRGRWTVRNARNVDWEALAVAPCGTSSCVYIGDVGDNSQRRPTVTLYRLREPLAPTATAPGATTGAVAAEALTVRYPDRAHNVEAMYVAPDGATVLITKANGHLFVDDARPRLYRVGAAAWGTGTTVTATLVDSLPEFAGGGRKRMVTDAALSADGRYLAVRTYEWLAIWPFDAASGLPRRDRAMALCDLSRLNERQGEGVGFAGVRARTARLAFSSEGGDQPLRLADCPLPAAP